jgi:hypothetical protein
LIAEDPEIFVQIAAYRDPELTATVADATAKAAKPDRLTFGICWQHDEGEEGIDELLADPRCRVIAVDASRARGPCWARNQLQQLYDGEEYTLQIDSHHRFAEGWDEQLIEMLESLRTADCPRPVLTSYVPHFDPGTEPGADEKSRIPLLLLFDRFASNGVLFIKPAFIADHETLHGPIPARFYSAHFCFADGRFSLDVPHDPNLYFHGEEPTMSVRAFSHGYDLFHPHRTVLWHQYTRSSAAKHWQDDPKWAALNALSFRRQRQLFGLEEGGPLAGVDRYGLGTARTVTDYEAFAGLDFSGLRVQRHTVDGRLPPNPAPGPDDWLPGVKEPFTYEIRLEADDVPELDDVDFWYVGAHDDTGREVDRQDLDVEGVAELLATGPPYVRTMAFEAATEPVTWTVWPHSKGQGWLERITRPLDATSGEATGLGSGPADDERRAKDEVAQG